MEVFMKVKYLLFLFLSLSLITAQTWQYGPPTTDFRFTRFDGEYFSKTGRVYFLGGRLSDNSTSGAVWCFIPDSGVYRSMGVTMPIPVSNYNICILQDNYSGIDTYGLYIVGGRTAGGPKTAAVQVYYPMSNTVRVIDSDPLPMRIGGTRIPIPGANVVYNNKMYVFGGFNESLSPYVSNETWVYDPLAPAGSRWSRITTANLSVARTYITTAVVNNKIYAIGGDIFNGTYLYAQKIVEVFDPENPDLGWQRLADLPDSSGETRAFGFDSTSPYGFANRIIVAGNGKWPNETNQCFIYDVINNTWSTFTYLNQARRNHAGVFIPGTRNTGGIPGIWVFGGRAVTDTHVLSSVEYYQLAAVGMAERNKKKPGEEILRITPNIFSHSATISYWVKEPEEVSIALYSVDGKLLIPLVNRYHLPGNYQIPLNGKKLTPGIYFIRRIGEKSNAVQRLTKVN
jgi:hypothetical protein